MTTDRGLNETPEERAARIQAAKERALAARAARERGEAPAVSAAPAAEPAEPDVAAPSPTPQTPTPVLDDRPRTASGTLKRDPNEEKKAPPATPEERAARIAAAKAAAAAARAAREAGGGATPAARPAAAAAFAAEATGAEAVEAAPPSDGLARTAKGTIKRDPNAPKKEPPATPEERAARIAAAKAAAAAAKARAAAAPPPAAAPAAAAAARPAAAAASDAQQAAFIKAFEAISTPLPSAADPIPRPLGARAERAAARAEFPMTAQMEAVVAAFRQAAPSVSFEVMAGPLDPVLVVDRTDLYRLLEIAKTHPLLDMRFLRCVSGVDLMDAGIEVVYHLKSLTTKHAVEIKTLLPAGDPVVDSVTPLWPGANWHERELMEMFGVRCAGHPDPRPLLLDEDMAIHPLLKAHPLQDLELRQGVNVF
jgi:NADH-quinone oxidoreductase subunit C